MDIQIDPSCIKTVKIKIRKNVSYKHATVTFPKDIVERYNLKDKDHIVICFVCKAGEQDPAPQS